MEVDGRAVVATQVSGAAVVELKKLLALAQVRSCLPRYLTLLPLLPCRLIAAQTGQ